MYSRALALAAIAIGALCVAPLTSALEYSSEALADRVPSLPGWGSIDDFNLFSGYITVDKAAGRALFYAYAESSRDAVNDPLVLWSNGGPGCSSLGGGFMSELGPFLPLPGGNKLQKNIFAWNRIANVLFVESPAFVGFSYSNTTGDRVVGDARTARDSRAFMIGFYQRFPYLSTKDLYLSGESYAGHYIPNLALEIVKGNQVAASANELVIPLRGFLLGNPLTDTAIDNHGAIDYWWHHAIISDQTWSGIKDNCNFDEVGPLLSQDRVMSDKDLLCDHFVGRASVEMGPINIYDIFADTCIPTRARHELEQLSKQMESLPAGLPLKAVLKSATKVYKRSTTISSSSSSTTTTITSPSSTSANGNSIRKLLISAGSAVDDDVMVSEDAPYYDPCIDDEVGVYLNQPEVQKALHANPGPWSDCTSEIFYSRADLLASMLPVYEQLLRAPGGLRMLIYSGDVDGILPVVGTRRWVASLGREETAPWRPWYSETQQVGGYVVEYDGISFASVRNAGHMVPYVQPERMYHMLERFLSEEEL